jgi:hypothetical protein
MWLGIPIGIAVGCIVVRGLKWFQGNYEVRTPGQSGG